MHTHTHKSLFDPQVYQECLLRIEALTQNSSPEWGKMDVAQMLAHCSEVQEVMNGKPLNGTSFLIKLFKGIIRKMVVSNSPFPRGTKTHPQYLQQSQKDFETEKSRLLKALTDMMEHPDRELEHPLFGKMTQEEVGWVTYKHLNHHLQQFGV